MKDKKEKVVKKTTKKASVNVEKKVKEEKKKDVKVEDKPKKRVAKKASDKVEKKVKEETKKDVKVEDKPKKRVTKKEKPVFECEIEKKDQKAYRVLSRIISVFSKILRICAMIITPIIFIMMIIIPIACKNIEINGNIVKVDNARFVLKDDYITVNFGEKSYMVSDGIKNMDQIVEFLNSNSINKIVISILLTLASLIISLVISVYLLLNLERLFDNFYRKTTPFESSNIKYIKNIAYLMIASVIASIIFNVIIALVCKGAFTSGIKTYSILAILVVYVIYYIFQYAVNMQNKIDTKICD